MKLAYTLFCDNKIFLKIKKKEYHKQGGHLWIVHKSK
jgi:hypothetical protein